MSRRQSDSGYLTATDNGGVSNAQEQRVCDRQTGFSIIVALFILLVIALLATALVTISGVEHQQPLLSLQSKRAHWAAQSGLQWGAHEAITDPAYSCPAQPAAPAIQTLRPSQVGLDGFTVSVSCSSSTHTEHGHTVTVYDIQATARNGTYGQRIDFAQRRYQIIVANGG